MMAYDVNDITEQFLHLRPKERRARFIAIYEDSAFFDDLYGTISAPNIVKLLKMSVWDKYIRYYLTRILEFSDERTITDEVFEKVKRYPWRKASKSFLISIAHCSVSVYQLHYICKKKCCVESFASLLQIYLNNECYSIYDVKCLLVENMCYWKAINWDALFALDIPQRKKEVVKGLFEMKA